MRGGIFISYPALSSAFLNITNRCNLACRYCFVAQNPTDMPLEIALRSIDYLAANAAARGVAPHVTFFGGEPTLLWDEIVVPTVEYARSTYGDRFSLDMTSNCVLLTRERLVWMKEHAVGLLFSIDGGKLTQDFNRPFHSGKGSFDNLEKLIAMIPTFFPHTIFRSTIIPQTCQHVFENIQFAAQSGYKNIYIIPDVFQEWADSDTKELRAQLARYGDYYIRAYRDGSNYIRLIPFEKAFGKIWRILHTEQRRSTLNCVASGKCGFCTNGHGSIDANGNIYACQELPSSRGTEDLFYIGNLDTGIDESRRSALIAAFDIQKVSGLACHNCSLNNICDGGCVANNYLISGSLNQVPAMYCTWNQLLIDEATRVANLLGDEKNETFRDAFVGFVKDGGYGL